MAAVVIITGGGGFLGQCLATAILKRGSICSTESKTDDVSIFLPVSKIVLADIAFPPTLQPTIEEGLTEGRVVKLLGDVSDAAFCHHDLLSFEGTVVQEATSHVSIFHLGAVMSGDGERDFDLALRVNLHGTLHMLEAARALPAPITRKFLFASAGAIVGSGAPTDYLQRGDVVSDASRATPHTTYGTTKACCELLLSDYGRRGFVDGRAVRLPSVVVRAGRPNAATTSCFSSVVREPLAGRDVIVPLRKDVRHAVTGARAAVHALLTVHDAKGSAVRRVLGYDRTVFLPAVAVSLGELEEAVYRAVTEESRDKLGKIVYEVDDFLSEVVGGFPTTVDADRALRLGVPPAPDAATLVREYAADFAPALAAGIVLAPPVITVVTPPPPSVVPLDDGVQIAVITGGGSGIGRGVALRLSQGGWAVVLAGRRLEALRETEALLEAGHHGCLCVPTDVSKEQDVEALFRTTEEQFGRGANLLFNNAGVNSAAASLEHVDLADFERVLKINVTGPFLCARAALRSMSKNGTGGRIINNGSISAQVPRPHSTCYTTSKHALTGLTKCLALDGRAHNVACGQIDFGNVVSELSVRTNSADGALQPDGTRRAEPNMSMEDAAETFWTMANLPLGVNILHMTVMATKMPLVGRG